MANLPPKQFIEKMFGTKLPPDVTVDQLRALLLQGQQSSNSAMADALAAPMPTDNSVPMPQGNARGGVRGKYESPMEFEARMNRERGPRGSFSGGGLDAFNAMQDRGLTVDEAGRKAGIIRSQGGRINADGTMSKAGARPAPQSSTGKSYDPVAERKNMLADAGAAVAERKNLQAADTALLKQQEKEAMTLGNVRGFANKYGSGQAKTVLRDAPRAPATVTLGRNAPFTLPLQEEIDILKKEQKGRGMPDLPPLRR